MEIPIRRAVIVIAVLILAYAIFTPRKYRFERERIEIDDGIPTYKELQSEAWRGSQLRKLAECESGMRENAIAVNDGNTGRDSKGIFQFQLPTFVGFAKKYDLFPHAEAAELLNLWTDPDAQIRVAAAMIRKEPNAMRHWYICSERLRLKAGIL